MNNISLKTQNQDFVSQYNLLRMSSKEFEYSDHFTKFRGANGINWQEIFRLESADIKV